MFGDLLKNIFNLSGELSEQEKVSQKCPFCGARMEGSMYNPTISCTYCGGSTENESYKEPVTQDTNQQVFEEDDADDVFVDNVFRHNHRRHGRNYNSVYAYIEKSGLFYSGEIPGITFSNVSLCDSYQECVDKLIEKYRTEKERAFFELPKQDINEIKQSHPNAKIIKIS